MQKSATASTLCSIIRVRVPTATLMSHLQEQLPVVVGCCLHCIGRCRLQSHMKTTNGSSGRRIIVCLTLDGRSLVYFRAALLQCTHRLAVFNLLNESVWIEHVQRIICRSVAFQGVATKSEIKVHTSVCFGKNYCFQMPLSASGMSSTIRI